MFSKLKEALQTLNNKFFLILQNTEHLQVLGTMAEDVKHLKETVDKIRTDTDTIKQKVKF